MNEFWHFLWAVVTHLATVVTGVLFMFEQVLKWFVPGFKTWWDGWFPPARRRPFEIAILILAFGYATFQVYGDQNKTIAKVEGDLRSAKWWAAYWQGKASEPPKAAAIALPGERVRAIKSPRAQAPVIKDEPQTTKRRLIAYLDPTPITTFDGKVAIFQGYRLPLMNVSQDTITISVNHLEVFVENDAIMTFVQTTNPAIVPQTQGYSYSPTRPDYVIPDDAKTITAEYEIDYDTIPASGIRRSYRKVKYTINWVDGRHASPRFESKIVDEWEK